MPQARARERQHGGLMATEPEACQGRDEKRRMRDGGAGPSQVWPNDAPERKKTRRRAAEAIAVVAKF